MSPIIEIDHLFFSYDHHSVLSNVSIEINHGEFVGIIGPNGGGKTTLIKLILGFLQPTQGKIEILVPSNQIGYVPQSLKFDREFPISVLEVVLSGLLSRLPWYGFFSKRDYQMAEEALEQVGLLNYKNHPFGQLSGGQAQRVLIARAIVNHPLLLLLDEPTASVDSQAEADIYAILKRMQGKMTILMVTHDLSAAVNYVERLLCVQGRVSSLHPSEVCEHYAMGLYHDPLLKMTPPKRR